MTSPALSEQRPAFSQSVLTPSSAQRRAARAGAHVLAWLLMGVANVIATWLTRDAPTPQWAVLITQHAYDLGHALALGLVCWLVVRAWQRWSQVWPRRGSRASWLPYAALALLAMLLAQRLLKPDLWSVVGRLVGTQRWALATAVAAALMALVVPASLWASRRLTRLIGHHPAWLLALLLAVGHQLVLSHLYLGLHAYLTWCAALLAACGLEPVAERIERGWHRRAWPLRGIRRVSLLALAAAALLIRTPAAVHMKMLQTPGSLIVQWRHLVMSQQSTVEPLQLLTRAIGAGTLVPAEPTPPTAREELGWLPEQPIVVVVGVDAMRADLLDKHPEQLPAMSRLRREGVYFPRAWSTAPSTTPAVASLFAGRYGSQLRWEPLKAFKRTERFPHNDPTPRVGELLSDRGIFTGVAVHMGGFQRRFGLTKGFLSELSSTRAADKVLAAWKRWMGRHHERASLCYLHFIDPHNPYNLAGEEGSAYERYLREVALVDGAIAEMRSHLRALGVEERVIFVLLADHGEAFGEHNSKFHGSTVYEEQTRIPLLIHHPSLSARTVKDRVSLIDVPPTLLDLFDVPAPAPYMGVSLLPSLTGAAVERDEPIFIEARRYIAMVFEDGMKLVLHKSGAAALYDLSVDPGESINIIDEHPNSRRYRRRLDRFVRTHGVRPFHLYH